MYIIHPPRAFNAFPYTLYVHANSWNSRRTSLSLSLSSPGVIHPSYSLSFSLTHARYFINTRRRRRRTAQNAETKGGSHRLATTAALLAAVPALSAAHVFLPFPKRLFFFVYAMLLYTSLVAVVLLAD